MNEANVNDPSVNDPNASEPPAGTPAAPKRRVTRDDVARLAGVSSAVVSYVLNGTPKPVAAATRQKVLDAVELLGYQPNQTARALSLGRSSVIGLVISDPRNPYFADLALEIDHAARAHGRTVMVLNSLARRDGRSMHIAGLGQQQLEGIIIADTLSEAESETVRALSVPVVLINQFFANKGFASIGVDHFGGAYMAVRHLIDLGHRRIAFIGGDPGIDPREDGWRSALRDADLEPGPAFHVPFEFEGGYQAGRGLAEDATGVTAAFIASEQQALAALSALHERGLAIPRDIAIVAFDGTTCAAYLWPPLSTVAQPLRAMADDAVRRIVTNTAHEDYTTYPMSLVIRASSGA
ncbi:MAG: LacI family DNA-binding transcriptional regulator [Microthrixaceae bacterium]|nr:LacI family DNA-binding transcriptional regulator [Microthrixaceae bacterium]